MSRNAFKGPKLPKTLLDQVGGAGNKRGRDVSRKDRRKAERQQKKATRSRPPPRTERLDKAARRQEIELSDEEDSEAEEARSEPRRAPKVEEKPVKSILKKSTSAPKVQQRLPSPTPSLEDGDVDGEDSDESTGSFTVSRHAAKAGLQDEDAAIAALERKLGRRGAKKSTAREEDGEDGLDDMDWLLGGPESGSEDESRGTKRKRAAPADEKWLRDKRRKAGGSVGEVEDEDENDLEEALGEDEDDPGEDIDGIENPFSEDELSNDDFAGFSEDEEAQAQPIKKARENPYVAPASTDAPSAPSAPTPGKYIPPSLRAKLASSTPDENLQQLQRQLQGQLNRLSEANMLSILPSVEQTYTSNARQHVTFSLVDLLITRISDPSRLEDPYLVLHAGFSAALYRTIGVAFGAQLLEKLVSTIDAAYTTSPTPDSTSPNKQKALNTLAFLSLLYTLHVVAPAIIFDYIRQLLSTNLSETAAELLLRILHFAGPQLRADDPSSLKDIVLLLQRKVADAGGEDAVPKRTKFLVREINDLKNNRQKAGGSGGAPGGNRGLASEHLTTMRKLLGSLASSRGGGKAAEPLRPTLSDIRDSEKKGKWWLPGASYRDPAKMASATSNDAAKISGSNKGVGWRDEDEGYDSETPGHVNLSALARAQGMNTDVRRKIFISIMGAADWRDAHARLGKLHLKAKQMLEVPRVLVHCVGAEGGGAGYNPFYALIARKICSAEGKVRKAFQFGLWDVLRRLEEGAEEEDDEGDEGMDFKKIGNLAKFFGALMAVEGGLGIAALRKVEFGPYMSTKVTIFAEALLTTVLLDVAKDAKTSRQHDAPEDKAAEAQRAHVGVRELFAEGARSAPEMAQPLMGFLEKTVARAEMAGKAREKRVVEAGCRSAVEGLEEGGKGGPAALNDDDEQDFESDGE